MYSAVKILLTILEKFQLLCCKNSIESAVLKNDAETKVNGIVVKFFDEASQNLSEQLIGFAFYKEEAYEISLIRSFNEELAIEIYQKVMEYYLSKGWKGKFVYSDSTSRK